MTEKPVDDGDVEASVGFWTALGDALSDLPAAIVRGPVPDDFKDSRWSTRVLMWPFFKPGDALSPADDTDDIVFETRVNTFYPHKWVTGSGGYSFFLVTTITVAFGGIHLTGWSYIFPSSTERTLWRIASLSITGSPIMYLLFGVLGVAIDKILLKDRFGLLCTRISVTPLVLLYTLSRLALLVIPFLCLRSLPPAVFHVVHWASFIPHV